MIRASSVSCVRPPTGRSSARQSSHIFAWSSSADVPRPAHEGCHDATSEVDTSTYAVPDLDAEDLVSHCRCANDQLSHDVHDPDADALCPKSTFQDVAVISTPLAVPILDFDDPAVFDRHANVSSSHVEPEYDDRCYTNPTPHDLHDRYGGESCATDTITHLGPPVTGFLTKTP